MLIRQIEKRKKGGGIDLCASIYKEENPEGKSSEDDLICELGSMNNGGLSRLIELSNSIHSFFLKNAIEGKRDSIASSQSYGVFYLVSQILREWRSGKTSLPLFGPEEDTSAILHFLPSLISAVTDPETTVNSRLETLNDRYYTPLGVSFNADMIYKVIHSFEMNEFEFDLPDLDIQKSQLMYGVMPSLKKLEESRNELSFHDSGSCCSFSDKIASWLNDNDNNRNNTQEIGGLFRFVTLADHIRTYVETNSGMSWEKVVERMNSLHAIRFEMDARTLLLTTRPSSKQINLFMRLGIEPPPLVLCEQDLAESVDLIDNDDLEVPPKLAYELVI